MFWMLVATFLAGFAGAGIGLILWRLSRRRLPRGVIPICAGLAMIAATIGQEYGWFDGVRSSMAEDLVVLSTREQQAWYQPWTYVWPWVRGFVSYSPSETVATAEGADVFAVQLRIQERWLPQAVVPIVVDCMERRWADITPEMAFGPDGVPDTAEWRQPSAVVPVVSAICDGNRPSG